MAFGFYCGLNILTKYVSGILLICFGCYLLFTRKGRACLKSWKLYLGAILGIGVTTIVYFAINAILSMIKIKVNVADFMPDGINNLLTTSELGGIYLKAIIVAVLFIVAFITISAILVKKRDVK